MANVMRGACCLRAAEGQRKYIKYRDLSVEQLGSIYERLLELEVIREEHTGSSSVLTCLRAKNRVSYYTPDDTGRF